MTTIMDRIRALLAQQQQGGPMPDSPPPPVGMPGMMAPPPQPMDVMGDPALAAGMAQGAMGGMPPMGPGRPDMMPPTAPGQPGGMPFAPSSPVGMPGMMAPRTPPSAMDGSVMSGRDHLAMLGSADPDQDETPSGPGGGDLLGIGSANAAEIGQGAALGRDLLNTPRATHATPLPVPRPDRRPLPMPAIRPRVPVPSSRPDVMPHAAPGYGHASGYDPTAAYAPSVTPQSCAPAQGGPRALFPAPGGGTAHGGTTGAPPAYLMDYIARMMGRG
jgi:hypothetical protein